MTGGDARKSIGGSGGWHDGTNANSIGVELCDLVEGALERWDGAEHSAMVERAANLVRQLREAYGIPKRKLTCPGS
ncbi:N-acetylmuramoyl-L-alanine amidase CwlA [Prauserella sediminis]|uniref:N-acetylmuramoyl-L-alanine amidase CwlA n=1 Tax=Prauserella sediminis TaxID=577680 RepID=A0A839XPV0_9PSEU|nr:N-acetylmuramoyl-L-alanine amidase [Prauserella sediminis]MBB3665260.1 N-acetylmuramoyl-L-alanine amidase CwlA [Prauserella sediminis]